MFTLSLLFPLITILIVYFFSNKIGSRGTWFLIWIATFSSFIISIEILFIQLTTSFIFSYYLEILPFFFFSSYFDVSWSFKVDYLSTFIIFLITIISFFIQTFSGSYIKFDVSYQRFIIYMSFFSFSILLLVYSSNLLVLFVGWEIVGIASFLLINFWYARQEANWGAFKAFAFNRIGDTAFIFSLIIFYWSFGTLEIDAILALANFSDFGLTSAFFFLMLAAFAKSAQILFHSWLPDAMEGPTPVSALLHSATMVTAGVYLILRFADLILLSSFFQFFISFTGLLTAFYAAVTATTVLDAKHSTAYTTLGQLGFMFFAVGITAFTSAIFHLFIHGCYKSFAFLENAIELYNIDDEQDGSIVNLNSFKFENFYDLFSLLVFLSINALPLASSSVSKELLVFSGFETFSNFFTFFFFSVLFFGLMDSSFDDNFSDYHENSFIYTDSAITLTVPYLINFSYLILGLTTIFIIFFTEDCFINLSFLWADFYSIWLFLDGSFLLLLPFFTILATYFFYPSNILFTSDDYSFFELSENLFYYDRYITNTFAIFWASSFWFFSTKVDKGFINFYFSTVFYRLQNFTLKFTNLFSGNFFVSFSLSFLFFLFAFKLSI